MEVGPALTPRPHPCFQEFMKAEFGEELLMADLPSSPRVAVTGTLADRYPADLHFFRWSTSLLLLVVTGPPRNYTSPMDILGVRETMLPEMSPVKRPDQQTVWQVGGKSPWSE